MANFLEYTKFDGLVNMTVDEELLADSIRNRQEAVLRLYGWMKPTLSLGRNQSASGINIDYCKSNNIDIVKRPTGGRAVFHNEELTYSFITSVNLLKDGHSVINSYKEISDALVIGFKEAGINLLYPEYKKVSVKDGYCMAISTGSDLSFQGKKLIGSAQFRKQDYILQHGSILLDIDRGILSNIFNRFDGIGSNPEFTTIKEINPEFLDIKLLSEIIKSGFEKKFSLKFS